MESARHTKRGFPGFIALDVENRLQRMRPAQICQIGPRLRSGPDNRIHTFSPRLVNPRTDFDSFSNTRLHGIPPRFDS